MVTSTKIDQVLNQSLHAIQDYQQLILFHQTQTAAVVEKDNKIEKKQQKVLQNLIHSLEDARAFLSKEMSENHVVQVDNILLSSINQAFKELMKDESTENKINFVHFALYGANVPFWNALRDVQNLLSTVQSLRAKSKKTAKIDELDPAKKK